MRIGVYSKFDLTGGSELRCAEIASEIARQGQHEPWLLAERDLPDRVRAACHPGVRIAANVMRYAGRAPLLYQMDRMVVVVTDSTVIPSAAYWRGESDRHGAWLNLAHAAPLWAFIFNYRISPAAGLASMVDAGRDVRIICANSAFADEVARSPKLAAVAGLPRIVLESPINPASVSADKSPRDGGRLRIGCHSKPVASKWDALAWPWIVGEVERSAPGAVEWRLMGCSRATAEAVQRCADGGCPITLRPEFSQPVGEFLRGVDAFAFITEAGRQEPWSRCVAEAMMSGCPVVARDRGGTRDQVTHGETGWLCGSDQEIADRIVEMAMRPELVAATGAAARQRALAWSSQAVVRRLLDFIDA